MAVDVTRFIKGKMLIFSKLSIKSFAYDFTDTFCFSTEEIKEIYNQCSIIKCHLYLNLNRYWQLFIFFMFICEIDCSIKESEARWLSLTILSKSEIRERLDTSDKIYKKFGILDDNLKKQMDLYEVEKIKNENICTIAINPRDYFEKFRNKSINKKHKGVKKDTKGICFDAYANRITDINQKAEQKKNGSKKISVKKYRNENDNSQQSSVCKFKQ